MYADRPKFIHIEDVVHRPLALQSWERLRHAQAHWIVECVAEFMGVFFYTYAGAGSTASMVIGNLTDNPSLGSLFQIGFAYAIGIVLAITICSSTSGGHFNPCITLCHAILKDFPWKKVPRYIIAQILGAYVACLLTYLQWRGTIIAVEAAQATAGTLASVQFTSAGTGGILALYATPGSNLGYIFANEFFVDFFVGITIWACIDPSNFFCPPAAAPYTIGLAYATIIWGYAPVGLAANSARDVGGRLAALTIYGLPAAGGRYAAIAALTNIPATLIAAVFYEIFFTDSCRVLPPAQRDFMYGHKAHAEHRETCRGARRLSESSYSPSHGHEKEEIVGI